MTTTILLLSLLGAIAVAGVADWGAFARGVRRLFLLVSKADRQGVRGEWKLELVGADGTVKDVREFRNLIVNVGLDGAGDLVFNPATLGATFHYVAIGTDATPETNADVALLAETARAAGAWANPSVAVHTVTYTFPAGTGTGAITEVGLLNDPAAGTLYNRKTFAAINKTGTDTLKATCTITFSNA